MSLWNGRESDTYRLLITEWVARAGPLAYVLHVSDEILMEELWVRSVFRARRRAGLSQDERAARVGTSRPTLFSHKHGHRSPTLRTAARILVAAGYELAVEPRLTLGEHLTARGRTVVVPSHLPRLEPSRVLATVTLPLHLNWSEPGRSHDLRDLRQRARVYEIVVREGGEQDLLAYIVGVCSSSCGRSWCSQRTSERCGRH
jgi:DNA-binding XRE family transcriptional regulator